MKKENFKEVKEITLIGHSILDYWNIESLNGKSVNNLGIAGISTKQYSELILDKGLISELPKEVILMLGTNDIVYKGWSDEQVLMDINHLISQLKAIRADIEISFLEITPTAFRIDRNNDDIRLLNQYLKDNLSVKWIALDKAFSDKYGKLDLNYSNDGLHLNAKGYEKLTAILEEELK